MKTVILVAAHKPYWMPSDPVYLPVQVGAAGKPPLGWERDDEGENISEKNAGFCELTGLYWLWKNVDAEVYGLCHYRRYFAAGCPLGSKRGRIFSGEAAKRQMTGTDILLPKKRHYWIETNESQYVHAHHQEDLDQTKAILRERYPDFLPAWDAVMKRRSGHRFNMFLMRKPQLEAYCAWLFDILLELERRLDISAYSVQDRRVFGYVGERLLDVWLEGTGAAYREARVVNLESQHWPRKIMAFVKRKVKAGPSGPAPTCV